MFMFFSGIRWFACLVWGTLPLVAAADFPWEQESCLPPAVVESALRPDWVFCETPCDWRPSLSAIFRPLVSDCRSSGEAVLKIASQMTAVTGVFYSTERRIPNMNALEALREKKVSCTGQSILLVCALRSVGIPARVVWVMTWNHIPGNHTWVEAWVDGAWQMIEFNEKNFNTPWVMESIGMLNPTLPSQRIYAVAGGEAASDLPLQVSVGGALRKEDVTERYLALAREWYAQSGSGADTLRVMVDVFPRASLPERVELLDSQGNVVSHALLPTIREDIRKFASLCMPRSGRHFLRSPFGIQEVNITEQPVSIIRLTRPK